jgi:hypothetical protein
VADGAQNGGYPERAALIAELCGLWKAARRPLPAEWETSLLDADGWQVLDRLADRLARHLSFEHHGRRKLRETLKSAVRRYKTPGGRSGLDNKQFATEVLDGLAREPLRRTLYLGVEHLKLPHGTTVGNVRFLLLSQDQELAQSFAWFGADAPAMVCEVEVVGGTEEFLRDRARQATEGALALVRQQVLFGGFYKIYLDQVMFGLDGKYTLRDGGQYANAGWWRQPRPFPMDYTQGNPDWLARLDSLSADYGAVTPELLERVDTCVGWLDVAARSDRWRIILPALFSAMEAILVPESSSTLKAGVVTVRSVALQVALEKEFLDPGEIMLGYRLRSDLVHGTPTSGVPDKEATDFTETRRLWAFNVFRDYLKLAKAIEASTVTDIVGYLDSQHCEEVCAWLHEHGGSAIVAEYKNSIALVSDSTG